MNDLENHRSIRASGLKFTAQREQTLLALEASDRAQTVEEIRAKMTHRAPGIPTVYRNLEFFVQAGWAESILGPDKVMRFIRCRTSHHHHHIQCEKCGLMVEVDGCHLETAIHAMAGHAPGFQITRHVLYLFGLCSDCRPSRSGSRSGPPEDPPR